MPLKLNPNQNPIPVTDATRDSDGVMTKEQVRQLDTWGADLLEVVDVAGNPRLRNIVLPESYLEFGSVIVLKSNSGYLVPYIDSGMFLGNPDGRHFGAVAAYWWAQKMGAPLTAAATVQPTCGAHPISGATTIDTIDPLFVNNASGGNGYLRLFPTGTALNWSAAGNITVAGTVADGLGKTFFWDVSAGKWRPMV